MNQIATKQEQEEDERSPSQEIAEQQADYQRALCDVGDFLKMVELGTATADDVESARGAIRFLTGANV